MAHNKKKANNLQSKSLIFTCAFSCLFLTTSVSKNLRDDCYIVRVSLWGARSIFVCWWEQPCHSLSKTSTNSIRQWAKGLIQQYKTYHPPHHQYLGQWRTKSCATRPQLIVMSLCWSPRQMWVLGDQNSLRSWPFHCDCSFTGAEFKFKPRHVFSITLWLMMAINNHINWIIKNWIIKNRIAISQWIYHSHYDAVAEFFIPSVSAT